MPLKHYTDRNLVRLLATETRRTDTSPVELSRAHVALGRFLAGELVDELSVEPREIEHPQGLRTGWRVAAEADIRLVPFLRAGLYAAEGVREVLPRAAVVHASPRRDVGLPTGELDAIGRPGAAPVLLIDAVVNTGASLEPVLDQLRDRGATWLAVLTLVTPVETARRLERDHPDVRFYIARLSHNQYVGKGGTDTGNRLFGTVPGPRERP